MIGTVAVPPARKLEDLIRLAELCVDLLRQNEEFYAEVMMIVNTAVTAQCCNLVNWEKMGLNCVKIGKMFYVSFVLSLSNSFFYCKILN